VELEQLGLPDGFRAFIPLGFVDGPAEDHGSYYPPVSPMALPRAGG
jgi:hypothetical protein